MSLTHRDQLVAEANGSLQTAQMLCWYILQQAGAESTGASTRVIDTPLDQAVGLAQKRMSGKFSPAVSAFLQFDVVCVELLRLLSRTSDGIRPVGRRTG